MGEAVRLRRPFLFLSRGRGAAADGFPRGAQQSDVPARLEDSAPEEQTCTKSIFFQFLKGLAFCPQIQAKRRLCVRRLQERACK